MTDWHYQMWICLIFHLKSYHLLLAHLIKPKNIIPEKIKYNPRGKIKHYLNNEKYNSNNRSLFKFQMYILFFQTASTILFSLIFILINWLLLNVSTILRSVVYLYRKLKCNHNITFHYQCEGAIKPPQPLHLELYNSC